MAVLPPTSQQPADRPISFLIDDEVSGLGPVPVHTLRVRPEDLTRSDPSRINVVQTLNGGAWADGFGPGIAMITIAGTTGWRRTEGTTEDGEGRFLALRAQVFSEWHLRREQAKKQAKDPSGVQLIFSDALDSIVATVAPMSFVLKRSRSRPLLFQYQIQMLVLSDSPGALAGPNLDEGPLSQSALSSLGLASLEASLDTVQAFANTARNYIERDLLAPVNSFLATTQAIYGKVHDTWSSVRGVSDSLISVANASAAAGANLFRTFALVEGIPQLTKGELMRVGAAYGNIYCVLRNALTIPGEFTDYSELYGASNCSSTAGGRPLSQFLGSNTMQALVPAPVAPIVAVSQGAQVSMAALSGNDVVFNPLTTTVAAGHAGAIGDGIVLS